MHGHVPITGPLDLEQKGLLAIDLLVPLLFLTVATVTILVLTSQTLMRIKIYESAILM